MKLISIENKLLYILFIISLLFFLNLFSNIRISFFHSILSKSIKLIVIDFILCLFIYKSYFL